MPDESTDLLSAANRLHHRGFTSPIMYSPKEDVLIGKIEGIDEEITWRTVDLVAFKREFITHVDTYLRSRQPDFILDQPILAMRLM